MADLDAAERVRLRLDAWLKEQGHGAKLMLAKSIAAQYGAPRSQSWVTGLITKTHKRQDLRLKDLDAVADAMGIPPGELVRKHDRNYLELTMEESRLIRYVRAMPANVRAHLLSTLDFLFKPQMDQLEDVARGRDRATLEARTREREGVRTTESGSFRRKRAR